MDKERLNSITDWKWELCLPLQPYLEKQEFEIPGYQGEAKEKIYMLLGDARRATVEQGNAEKQSFYACW